MTAQEQQRLGHALYLDFGTRRKKQEARPAEHADEAELKALETKLKHRSKH